MQYTEVDDTGYAMPSLLCFTLLGNSFTPTLHLITSLQQPLHANLGRRAENVAQAQLKALQVSTNHIQHITQ